MKTVKKKLGRPPTGVGAPVLVRLHEDALNALDTYRRSRANPPSRPEAVRQLVSQQLMFGGVSMLELADAIIAPLTDDDAAMLKVGASIKKLFAKYGVEIPSIEDALGDRISRGVSAHKVPK